MMMQLNSMAIGAYDTNSSRWIRPMQFQDIPIEMRDNGFLNITPEARRDLYQLATVDTVQTSFLQSSGVVLAIVAHRTRNAAYIARCIELLEAVNSYVPLQRPGSTYHDQNVSITADGDGIWLATAWGIDAIVEMLSALKDDVPVNLRDRLKNQLRQEVLRITTDWADKRPWFVKGRRPQSNQWIEPNIGLVKACMYLGDPALTDAYNLGAENIAASLAMYGADGSYPEGVSYAEMTLGRVHQIVHQMAIGGDARFVGVPFVNNNWRWLVQMNMPGKMLVNSYDSAHSALYSWAVVAPLTSVSAAALSSSDPAALSAIRWLYPGLRGNCTLETIKLTSALEASSSLQPSIGLPTYDYFPDQQQLVWRSKFEPIDTGESTAWALWIRGGSLKDLHCHRDQGQVSVYAGNQIVLMDCGTPSYGDAIMESYYHAPAGHGVLQIGATQPYQKPVNVPISVGMLGVSGGSVTIDCTSAFSGTLNYMRSINWNQLGRVEITDAVRLPSSVSAGSEVLRFHTGSVLPLEISGSSQQWRAHWQGNEFVFNSDVDIEVTQVMLPDAVLPQKLHQALIVRLAAPATTVNVRSVLTVGIGTNSP